MRSVHRLLAILAALSAGVHRLGAQIPAPVPGCYSVTWTPRPGWMFSLTPVADTLRLGPRDRDYVPDDTTAGGAVGAGVGPLLPSPEAVESGNWSSWRIWRDSLNISSPGIMQSIGLMLAPTATGFAGRWSMNTDLAPEQHGTVQLRRIECRAGAQHETVLRNRRMAGSEHPRSIRIALRLLSLSSAPTARHATFCIANARS